MNKFNYILTAKTLIINYENNTHALDKGTTEYEQVVKCLKEKNFEEIPNIINASVRLKKYSNGNFSVENGVVIMDEEELPSLLSDRIISFEKDGLPYEPLVNFWNNLKNNPSYRARNQLFKFLEHNGHPITDDGCFIAYKGVTTNFKDCHTKTFDNSVGSIVCMPREKVDDDPCNTCSSGLHVASYNYAHNYYGGSASGLTIEVKVNPADVVAVPVDYDGEKMRVCKYEVVGVSKGQRTEKYIKEDNDNLSLDHNCENCENCEDYEDNWYDDYIDYTLKEEIDETDTSEIKYLDNNQNHKCNDDDDKYCK